MGIGDNIRKAAENAMENVSENEPDPDRSGDAAARDSLAGDMARKIDPELGTPDAGEDAADPDSRG